MGLLTLLLGYSGVEDWSLLRGRKVTSPGIFCLFITERICEAVRSVSTMMWNSLGSREKMVV